MKIALADITRLGGSEREVIPPPSPPTARPAITSPTGKGERSESGAGKKGGIFKKLKEKRSKKRSVIGPETSMSVSGVIGESWRSISPVIKEEKKSKKTTSKEKLNVIKLNEQGSPPHQSSRSESVSSREDKERESPSARKRSWSHGNIHKVLSDAEQDITSHMKLTHSGSISLSPTQTTPTEGGGGGGGEDEAADRYVIHGPSSGETAISEEPKPRKPLYDVFGSHSHHETLKELEEFLDSVGETEPVDLSILEDWDGWMIGSRDTAK